MKAHEIKVNDIARIRAEAKRSRHIADKSAFDRVFETECRRITDGKAFNVIHIKEMPI